MTILKVPPHTEESAPWAFRKTIRGIDSYRASVPPLISTLDPELPLQFASTSREIASRVIELEVTAEPSFMVLEPFLVRTEAVASSRIEDEITTIDQLARAEAGRKASNTARSVHGAARAVTGLIAAGGRGVLETNEILEAHGKLMSGDPAERVHAGRMRTVQNWIGGPSAYPIGADFVPPLPARVPGLVEDLLVFMARTDIDPLVQAAIAHAQFESIHPFVDGNGRIGRALINAQLRRRDITRTLSLPLAAVLSAERDRYFAALVEYRGGNAGPVLDVVSESVRDAAIESIESVRRLAAYPEVWAAELRPRAGSATALMLQNLPANPIFDIDDVERIAGVSESAAYRAVARLEEVGVVRRLVASKRDGLWGAGAILDEADQLLARIAAR